VPPTLECLGQILLTIPLDKLAAAHVILCTSNACGKILDWALSNLLHIFIIIQIIVTLCWQPAVPNDDSIQDPENTVLNSRLPTSHGIETWWSWRQWWHIVTVQLCWSSCNLAKTAISGSNYTKLTLNTSAVSHIYPDFSAVDIDHLISTFSFEVSIQAKHSRFFIKLSTGLFAISLLSRQITIYSLLGAILYSPGG